MFGIFTVIVTVGAGLAAFQLAEATLLPFALILLDAGSHNFANIAITHAAAWIAAGWTFGLLIDHSQVIHYKIWSVIGALENGFARAGESLAACGRATRERKQS